MKIKFIHPEKKDNKTSFQDLKVGDTFTLADPQNNVRVEVYMKVGKAKGDTCAHDTVVLGDGRLACFYDLKREVITQDQLYVFKVDSEISVSVD